MENITLEQVVKEEKKRSIADFFLGILYIAPGLGAVWVLVEGLEYLQIKTFSTSDSIVTTSNLGSLYYISIIIICVLIIPTFLEFITINRSKLTVKQYLKRYVIFVIPCIPILYLSFYSYLDIGEHSITYDPLWPGAERIYDWEDIELVIIDKEDSRKGKSFDYYVYFKDGTNLDIWGSTRMNIEELKRVDDKIRALEIPKYIDEPPYEKGLTRKYGNDPKRYKIVQQIISE